MAKQTSADSEREKTNGEDQSLLGRVGDSVAETVGDVKETVVDKLSRVGGGIAGGTIDLREQFKKHPVAWTLGAAAFGLIVGPALYRAARDTDAFDRLKDELADLGDGIVDELTWVGDNLADGIAYARPALVPVLATAVVPLITKQITEAFGVDISKYLDPDAGKSRKRAKKKNKKDGKKR